MATINPEMAYTGHTEGGLQGHSIGGLYPWTIIGYGNGEFEAVNLKTNERKGRQASYSDALETLQ